MQERTWKEYYINQENKEHEKTEKLNQQNRVIEADMRERKEIPNWYSCSNCHREFVSRTEKIKPFFCNICLGEIK